VSGIGAKGARSKDRRGSPAGSGCARDFLASFLFSLARRSGIMHEPGIDQPCDCRAVVERAGCEYRNRDTRAGTHVPPRTEDDC
jgi:hypothetical protein